MSAFIENIRAGLVTRTTVTQWGDGSTGEMPVQKSSTEMVEEIPARDWAGRLAGGMVQFPAEMPEGEGYTLHETQEAAAAACGSREWRGWA